MCVICDVSLLGLIGWTILGFIIRIVQMDAYHRLTIEEIRAHYTLPQFIIIIFALGPVYWFIWRPIVLLGRKLRQLWRLLGEYK